MRWSAGWILVFATTLAGCNVARDAKRNLVNEPALYMAQHKFRKRMRADAAVVWEQERERAPKGTYSSSYADGFVDGYSDHLINGGVPQAPVAPPARYRRHADSFTAVGQKAQHDYLTGFKRGADLAAINGCRRNTLVPLDLTPPPPEQPLSIQCVEAPATDRPPDIPKPMPPAMRPAGVAIPAVPPPPQPVPNRAPADRP